MGDTFHMGVGHTFIGVFSIFRHYSITLIRKNMLPGKKLFHSSSFNEYLFEQQPVLNAGLSAGLSTPGSLAPLQPVVEYPRIEAYIAEVLRRENFGGPG